MAVLGDRPYTGFNVLVDLGNGVTDGPQAGFQEVSGLGTEVTVVEYRNGDQGALRTVTIHLQKRTTLRW